MNNDLLYRIAITKIPNIGHVHAKQLIRNFDCIADIFKASKSRLEKIEGIGSIRAASIKSFKAFSICEKEIDFIEKQKIKPIFFTEKEYPGKLMNCYDSPVLLYFKGNIRFNEFKTVSVVGTRNNTEYGKAVCEKLIEELASYNINIISGLAYGIDTIAHKAALKNNLKTTAILAHGLDRIYPYANKKLAEEIIENGGLLTDYTSGTNPDRQNFPGRNRITAGICDALVIIETGKSGGSQITAEIANSYNKDVFAFPGRTTDLKSDGCHQLIKNNKACLITNANDLVEIMGWNDKKNSNKKIQRALFINHTEEEKKIMMFLSLNPDANIDNLILKTQMSYSAVAHALLNLEVNGIIVSLPGKRYRLT